MSGTDRILTEEELEQLLKMASVPQLPMGFEQRLARRIASEAGSNVVQFPRRAKSAERIMWRWPVPAALAASLIIGIWLGAQGSMSSVIESATETAMLGSTSDFAPAGLDDISDIDMDNAS
ncbi:MAG: hypothetical protein ABJA10_01315 [Aestuariivirga sp.]